MSTKQEVLKAAEQFYAALNSMLNGDAGPLADIWSHESHVTTMHPIGGREVGWDSVWESWVNVAKIATDGQVALNDRIIEITGEVAYELGVEEGHFRLDGEPLQISSRVTNIYRREAGGWKIVHHHTDVAPAMLEALGRA